jgi:hypothetical protein
MGKERIWILTEEFPKLDVIEKIIYRVCIDHEIGFISCGLRMIPFVKNGVFSFTYNVIGFSTPKINGIFIKIISGYSSCVDFLVYFQESEPTATESPLYAIEETKTDDSESRNTGIYQRCTKFVYLEYFYPSTKKIMLYNLKIKQNQKPTDTNVFGSKLLATYGVEILGKIQNHDQVTPFESIEELIEYKNKMKLPPKGNIPILINKKNDRIEISGRLIKAGTLSHDPNIGALSIISRVLRKLKWIGDIIITQHGLSQENLNGKNKFIYISNLLEIQMDKLKTPKIKMENHYWKYERSGEKLVTILVHVMIESFTSGYSIFENHAGCERSYFIKSDGSLTPLKKYRDRELYKKGDKSQIIHIPDLVLLDVERLEIINIEGKKYSDRKNGISELLNYESIENEYIKPSYPSYSIIRTLVVYGGTENIRSEIEIGFALTESGCMVLGFKAPGIFREALSNLLDYWKC